MSTRIRCSIWCQRNRGLFLRKINARVIPVRSFVSVLFNRKRKVSLDPKQAPSIHSYNRHLFTKAQYPVYLTQQSFFRMLYAADRRQWSKFESLLVAPMLLRRFTRTVLPSSDTSNAPVSREADLRHLYCWILSDSIGIGWTRHLPSGTSSPSSCFCVRCTSAHLSDPFGRTRWFGIAAAIELFLVDWRTANDGDLLQWSTVSSVTEVACGRFAVVPDSAEPEHGHGHICTNVDVYSTESIERSRENYSTRTGMSHRSSVRNRDLSLSRDRIPKVIISGEHVGVWQHRLRQMWVWSFNQISIKPRKLPFFSW